MEIENIKENKKRWNWSQIKGVIFDIDGTLLDSMPIWWEVGARFLRQQGITPESDLAETIFTMSLEESAVYFQTHYGVTMDVNEICAGVLRLVRDFYCYEVELKDGVREFLAHVKQLGIPMVLATTGEEELAMAALTRLGIADCFSGIFTCSRLRTTKREPLIYLTAAKSMGCSPEETVVVEDVLHAVLTAKKAGFHTIAVEDTDSAKDRDAIMREAEKYVQTFEELILC